MLIKEPYAPQRKRLTKRRLLIISAGFFGICALALVFKDPVLKTCSGNQSGVAFFRYIKPVNLVCGLLYRSDRHNLAKNTLNAIKSLPTNFIASHGLGGMFDTNIEIPKLNINLPLKSLETIEGDRWRFLQQGYISDTDSNGAQEVKGSIQYLGEDYPSKLKLKGLFLDHIQHPYKWSFKIELKDGGVILGMNRFSLQHPVTRFYQGEAVYQYWARQLGIISPRHRFVDVSLNGESLGLMLLEEDISKELIENNERREGVVFKFDSNQHKEGVLQYYVLETNGLLDGQTTNDYCTGFETSDIEYYQKNTVDKNAALARQAAYGVSALQGLVDGTVTPSQIFDLDATSAFIAETLAWRAHHNLHWTNLKFYLNPITFKFETIPYESNLNDLAPPNDFAIAVLLLKDEKFKAAVQQKLRALALSVDQTDIVEKMSSVDKSLLKILHLEFPSVAETNFEPLSDIDRVIAELEAYKPSAPTKRPPPDQNNFWLPDLPEPVKARVVSGDEGPYIEIINNLNSDIKIESLEVTVNGESVDFSKATSEKLPLTLPRNANCGTDGRRLIQLFNLQTEGEISVEGTARELTTDKRQIFHFTAKTYQKPLTKPDLEPNTLAEIRAVRHLVVDETAQKINVRPGQWRQNAFLILPNGYSLNIPEGTEIVFGESGGFIVNGPLNISGTAKKSVHLKSADSQAGWNGISVLEANTNGGTSVIRNAFFSSSRAPSHGRWSVTGGLTFYKSDLQISDTAIEGSLGEDAINVISSHLRANRLTIANSLSDGLDGDFVTGSIVNSNFENIGGDAIDVSGSKLIVGKSQMSGVKDKAVSAGEDSEVTISKIDVTTSGTGVVSKDGSTVHLFDSSFTQMTHHALMSYEKKAEYGPGELTSERVHYEGSPDLLAIAQLGSRLILDGQKIKPVNIDIDEIYKDGYMKK